MSGPAEVLRGQGLGRTFGTGARAVAALAQVDLRLEAGRFVALVGPSGSGKTTLLALLGLLDAPSEGRLWLFGQPVETLSQAALTRLRRRVGFIFQDFALVDHWNAWQNVTCSLVPEGVPARERRRRALERLEAVGIGAKAESLPRELSGGERQRVAVARALLDRPGLLLADEPTSNVDEQSGEAVAALLEASARAGAAVVVATHDRALTARADEIWKLQGGRIVSAPEAPVRRPGPEAPDARGSSMPEDTGAGDGR
jgi:ABC-type lipoprotein export system ATPase subunit